MCTYRCELICFCGREGFQMREKGRVLIVDDDANARATAEALLFAEGHDLAFASSGSEALTKASELVPDLVLLDLLIPSINGWEVARRIRENPATKDIKILMLSIVSNGKKASEVGADAYIMKPFSMDKLLNTIDSLLR